MEYRLDNRAVLTTDRKHGTLYAWSIKEFDKNGRQIGGDQIPWKNLISSRSLSNSRDQPALKSALMGFLDFTRNGRHKSKLNSIKILANSGDQQLENPQGLELVPPALGYVKEFDLTLLQRYPVSSKAAR